MARIIPWKLPDVQGGSIGGYTPAPTPEPEDSQEYYDIENVVLSRDTPAYGSKASGSVVIKVEGINVVDLTGVASVSILAHVGWKTTSQEDADAATRLSRLTALVATQILNPNSYYNVYSVPSGNYVHVGAVGLIVYNGNGEILKQYTLSEDMDGE